MIGLGLSLALALGSIAPSFAQQVATQPPAIAQETVQPVEPGTAALPAATQAAGEPDGADADTDADAVASGVGVTDLALEPDGAKTQSGVTVPGVDKSALPHDLSPWGMFMAADIVVKTVMLSLAFASVVTWTIWLGKSLELLSAKRRLASALRVLSAARSLHDAEKSLSGMKGPAVELARVTRAERLASADLPAEGIKDRVATALNRVEARAGRTMSVGTGLLATIGSTAPFVGLFGTVWGIMNSFIGISQAQTTNLAIVAPGIAEALLATAIGLVVDIPAVVIYNVFARAISGYRANLGDASAFLLRLLSRDLDREATMGALAPVARGDFAPAE